MATKKSDVRKYLDKLVKNGAKEIKVTWEGGNDDGCYNLFVDRDDIDFYDSKRNAEARELIDLIANKVGYGSFAGDFTASGELVYDVSTSDFVGEDSYEESVDYKYKFKEPLKVVIPKNLWFDIIDIEINGDPEDLEVAVQLSIMNGPVVTEHTEFESNAEAYLRGEIGYILDTQIEAERVYYRGSFKADEISVNKDGKKEILIKEMNYSKYEGDSKSLRIHIQ